VGEPRPPDPGDEAPVTDGAAASPPFGHLPEMSAGGNDEAVLVIAGMHRSGTSLMASVFGGAGVHIGDRLDGPGQGNPWGHFEDLEFQEFQDRVLRRVGKTFLTATPADLNQPTAEELEEARALVARRRGHRLWGWKDPRTCLFLEFWHPLLDQPRYVFVYRHPVEVALSLLRRGAEVDLQALENPAVSLEAWRVHNQAILDFYRRHPDRCVLGHIRTLTADLDRCIATCATKLDLALASGGVCRLYHAEDLSEVHVPLRALATLRRLMPEVTALYRRLEEAADLPDAAVSRPPTVRPQHRGAAGAELRIGAASDVGLAREVLGCLARLDLETVLAGKAALDAVRRRHIQALEAQRREILARSADSRAEQERLGVCLEQALRQTAALEAQHRLAQAQVIEQVTQNAGLRAEVALLERGRMDLEARIGQAQDRLLAATAQAAAAEARAGQLAERLATSIEEARQRVAEVEAAAAASAAALAETLASMNAENVGLREREARHHHEQRELATSIEKARQCTGDAEAAAAAYQARARELEASAAALAETLASVNAENAGLRQGEVLLHHEHREQATSIEEARRRIAEVEAVAAAYQARAGELETSAALLAQERDDKERLLVAMVQTRVWRAAQKWYAVKRAASRLFAPDVPTGPARTNGSSGGPMRDLSRYIEIAKTIPGWRTGADAAELARVSFELPDDAVIVEVGVFLGRSTVLLAGPRRLRGSGKVYGVDPFDLSGDSFSVPHYENILAQIGGGSPEERCLEYIRRAGLSEWIEVRRGVADEVAADWSQPIDLLLLDGDQSPAGARAAYDSWLPFLKIGGVIALGNVRSGRYEEGHDGNRRLADTEVKPPRFEDIRIFPSMVFAKKATA
jgi:Methyltransferase domain